MELDDVEIDEALTLCELLELELLLDVENELLELLLVLFDELLELLVDRLDSLLVLIELLDDS